MIPRYRFLLLVLVPGLMLGLAAPMQAQMGGLEGDVRDMDGKPLVGVTMQIVRTDMKGQYETKTDSKGHYVYAGLAAGRARYTVRAIQDGKLLYEFTGVQIPVGEMFRLDFSLKDLRKQDEARLTEEQKRQIEEQRKAIERDKSLREEFDVGLKLIREPSPELVCSARCRANTTDNAACVAACQEQAGQNLQKLANEEAAAAFERAAAIDPSQYAVWANLARAYQANNNVDKSTAAYEKALELKPDDAAILVNLSQNYAKSGRVEEARAACEKASQLNPQQAATCYFNIGVIFYNTNQLKAALEPLRKATELDPKRAEAFYWLGVCLFGTAETAIVGDQVKTVLQPGTRESFEQYLTLEPTGRYADDAKAMLAAVEQTVPASVSVQKKKKN